MMTYSYFTFYMTVFGIMLLLGQPGYMMAPKSTRQGVFIASMLQVFFFNANVISLAYQYFKGVSSRQSLLERVHVYLTVEQIAAYLPAMWIFLFDGLAFSPYALFNRDYGKWDKVDDIPGMDDYLWGDMKDDRLL